MVGWWRAAKGGGGANMKENPSKISNRNVLDLVVSHASCHWLAQFGENTLKKKKDPMLHVATTKYCISTLRDRKVSVVRG